MDKDRVKIIKSLERDSKDLVKDNIFDDILLDIHRGIIQALETKYPDLKRYIMVAKSEFSPEDNKRLEKKVISDAEMISSKLQKFVEEYKEIVVQSDIKNEFIDFAENVKSFLQVVVNYFVTEDKDAYIKKLADVGLDIRHILSVLDNNFKE